MQVLLQYVERHFKKVQVLAGVLSSTKFFYFIGDCIDIITPLRQAEVTESRHLAFACATISTFIYLQNKLL
jgi:hypothetical protein